MNTILFAIIALPVVEILVMIKIGQNIGAINTVLLIISTAVIGLFFARIQSIKTIKSGFVNIYQNKIPIYELLSGASIAIAAIFLITPGFITDTIGFLLLIPFSRKIIISFFLKNSVQPKSGNETIEAEIVDDKKDEL
jgi:UPF0716 protein FxsA